MTTPLPSSHSSPPPAPRHRMTLPRFVFVMALLLAAAAFPQSALFTIRRIDVSVDGALSARTVIAIAGVHYGDRLFATDAAGALRRLLADPRIRSADLRLRPPHTVSIIITERRPVVALAVGDRYALVDSELVVVALSEAPGRLPVVIDLAGRAGWARPGLPVASGGARLAVAALPLVPPVLRDRLAHIRVAAGGDLAFVLDDGLEVRAGGLTGLDERLGQLLQVLDALRSRGVQVSSVDLRYAGSVVVKPVNVVGAGDAR